MTSQSRFDPQGGKMPWRREWQPTPVFLPAEFHGQRNLVGYSPWGCKESDMAEQLTHTLHCLQCRRPGFDPWVRKIPWRWDWLLTPVFLPGEFHGQRNLVGYIVHGSTGSLASQRHPGKFPKVPGRRRGTRGFPAAPRERPDRKSVV